MDSCSRLLVVGILFGVLLLRLNDKRWQKILSSWVRDQGYRIISADYRVFRLGPFTWTSTPRTRRFLYCRRSA